MKTSQKGLAILTAREGLRLRAYLDTRGIWTIGVGHTGRVGGISIHGGMVIDQIKAMQLLAQDVSECEQAINELNVPLADHQFDACVSLAYNIGCGGFTGSSVAKMLRRNNFAEAADDFLLWEKPPELRSRRVSEREQFLTPYL